MSYITRVEIGRFDYDFVGQFKFFSADPDGKVRRPSVLVRLTDSDGVQGWGQAVPVPTWTYETVESVETSLAHYLAPSVLNADPSDMASIHARMEKALRPALTVGQPLAKAAIDLACYDLTGKRRQESVASMLGGARRGNLTLGWTINAGDMAVVEQQLEQGLARGYRHFNFKVGPPQSGAYDLELARRLRAAAPEGFLWADANTGYTLETAREMLPKLADAGVDVIESPLPPMRVRDYQALRRQGALPIYMDEGIISPVEAEAFIALEMMDGITIKCARSAGLWASQQIVRLAQDTGLGVLGSGLSDPDLSLLASVHLFAWAGIERPCALNGPQFLGNTLIEGEFWPSQDVIAVPASPGLGARLSKKAEATLSEVAAA